MEVCMKESGRTTNLTVKASEPPLSRIADIALVCSGQETAGDSTSVLIDSFLDISVARSLRSATTTSVLPASSASA